MRGLDFTSPTWRALEKHAQEQLSTLREKNDSLSLDEVRTAELRGRILVWKELLALPQQAAPAPTADVGSFGY